MRKVILFSIAILCILLAFPSPMAFANTGIADDVYIKQNGSLTCTLASATMVIRARAQLCGYSDYTAITENEVYSSAWIEGAGLRTSFTYSFSENSVSMNRAVTNGGISLDSLKSILNDHPEGISLYCRGGGESTGWQDAHAVFLTDYEGNTLYCKDPAYDSGRITLGSSRLGALYGDQADILENVTHYWYVSSYSIKPSYVDFGDDFYAVILHYDGWMPISKVEENDKIYLKTEDGSARQIWRFQRQNEGRYEGAYVISSCYDGKVLEMHDGIRERCVQLTAQSYFWDGAYQKWYLIPYGNGYILKNCHYRDEDWVMDLYAGDVEDGNIIQINNKNNSRAQMWAIYRGDDVQLKGPKLTVTPGNSKTPTTFTWNRVYGANTYNLKVFKDKLYEGQTYHQYNADSGCGVVLPAGKYFAYVDAVNYHKYKASDTVVEFAVSEAYRVQYDANGGRNAPESQIKINGEPLILQRDCPTLAEHFFLGWATDAAATTPEFQPGDTYSVDADLTLFAVWQLNEYTITYNANGGTGAPPTQTKNYDSALKLSSDIPKRETSTGSYTLRFKIIQDDGSTLLSDVVRVPWTISYNFKSWNTEANGSGTSYNPGATYTDNASATLYAQWNSTKTTTPVPLPDSPTRQGYVFMGWATTKTATSGMFGSYTPTRDGDVTLYPTWKIMDVILPAALTEIGNEAFENCGAAAVTIPSGCTTIGSRAFADNPSLVYVLVPASVTQIANDAFVNCPNVTIYCYSGSIAATYAAEQSIRYVLLSDDWVLAEEVSLGATVTEEKWTYQKSTTETMTSTDPNADGWTQAGFE